MKRQFHHCNAYTERVGYQGSNADIFYSYNTPICASVHTVIYDEFGQSRDGIYLWLDLGALDYSVTTTRQLGRYLGELFELKRGYFCASDIRDFMRGGYGYILDINGFRVINCGMLYEFFEVQNA